MKKILLLISYLLIFITCTRSVDKQKYLEKRLKEVNLEYQQGIKDTQIPLDLLDHFPENIGYLPVAREKSYAASNKCITYMLFEYNLPQTTIDSINNLYTNTALQISGGNDPNLIVVKSKLQIELYGKPGAYKTGVVKSYPIPFLNQKSLTIQKMLSQQKICTLQLIHLVYLITSKYMYSIQNRAIIGKD